MPRGVMAETPLDYAKPEPPRRWTWQAKVWIVLLVLILLPALLLGRFFWWWS